MNKTNIWIDCDPGIDDAVALAMAAASRNQLNVLGISTVAGNQTSDRVTGNALKLTTFFGMDDVPVVRGARGPLVRPVEPAEDIHGADGLGGCGLPETEKKTASESGIFYMYSRIMGLPEGETVTLVPTGPMTNIALLLRTFPGVKERIGRIVMLAPPNHGSPEATFYNRLLPFAGLLVPPVPDLRDVPAAAVHQLPVPQGFEIGVIAGSRDHKAPIASTHLETETDHIVLDAAHAFIMNKPEVQRQTLFFLQNGRFDRE